MIQALWQKVKYRITPVICLVLAVAASKDVFPEYNFIRYGFIIAGVLSIFIGGHGAIIKGIAILEILISFAVVFEKTNKAEFVIEGKKIARLEATLLQLENCEIYTSQWAIRDCSLRNESKQLHNSKVNQKLVELKTNISAVKIFKADPSLLAFLIFSCALPILSFLSAKKIEVEKEIVYQDREVEKIVEVEKVIEKEIPVKVDLIQYTHDLFSSLPDSTIGDKYKFDRRSVKKLRVQYCTKNAQLRTVNVQSHDNLRLVKKEPA